MEGDSDIVREVWWPTRLAASDALEWIAAGVGSDGHYILFNEEPDIASRIDLSKTRRIHVVGIGGSGMSAIATVLCAMGHDVSGSDLQSSAGLDRLRAQGVSCSIGHHVDNVSEADLVVVSTAVPQDNVEVVAARELGIPVKRRAEILAAICATRPTVAVGGTHGKTTTTALLATALREGGVGSSFIVGGEVLSLGGGGAWGGDGWFVVEADESDGTFLELAPTSVVVTNIEADHLDHYGSFSALRDAFRKFMLGPAGPRVVCVDDPVVAEIVRQLPSSEAFLTYGVSTEAAYRIVEVELERSSSSFILERNFSDGHVEAIGRLDVPMPGLHNASNAAGAAVAALALGASFDAIARAFAGFKGVERRLEPRGELEGIALVDDYAHLPSEVKAAVAATKGGGWGRVVCVFQPHRFTRTAALANEFASVFSDADILVVTEIYPAGEDPIPGVSGESIAQAVSNWVSHNGVGTEVHWIPKRSDLRKFLTDELRPGDCCLTLGAGDLTTLPTELMRDLEQGNVKSIRRR